MNHWAILESEKNLVDENETSVKIDFDFHLLVEFISKFNVGFYAICRKNCFFVCTFSYFDIHLDFLSWGKDANMKLFHLVFSFKHSSEPINVELVNQHSIIDSHMLGFYKNNFIFNNLHRG